MRKECENVPVKESADTDNKITGNQKGKVGAALLRLQQLSPETDPEEDASLQDFFRELQKPRSREYIEQVLRCMELSRKIAERKGELAREQNVGEKYENPEGENPKNESGNREGGGGSGEDKLSAKTDTQEAKPTPAWVPKVAIGATNARKDLEWKKTEKNRLQEELNRLEWELKQQQKQLYDRLPKGNPYLTSIYLSENEEELFRRGILTRSGVPYSDVEELFESCNATTEQECEALRLGDRVVRERPSPLLVEVYLHAVCKVFGDGTTQMIRG